MSHVSKKLFFGLNVKNADKNGNKITPVISDSKVKSPLKQVTHKDNGRKRKIEDKVGQNGLEPKRQKIDYDVTFFSQDNNNKQKVPLSEEKLAQIHKEKINHFRNERHIHVYGTDMPDPIEAFDQLFKSYQIDKNYLENLMNMEIKVPTPVQMQAITAILHKREVMVCAPTGSGKTLAFGLPILHKLGEHKNGGFRALVLAPTRELAKQIQSEIVQISKGSTLKIRFLLSSKTVEDRKKWMNADMVITTPKKFVYVLKKFRSELSLKSVEWLVVDESDKLYEDGDMGFRQQLGNIYKACYSSSLRTLLFSATFSKEVEEWCQLNLDNLLRIYIGNINAATNTVDQRLVYTGFEEGKIYALRNIFKEFQPPVLIFVQSKKRADELFIELLGDGMNVQAIHSDKSDVQRDGIVKNFINGNIHILICSDVMARGLDFKNVNLVINYDFPTSAVAYIHRIGRTGRAGRPGKAVTFFTDDDVRYLRSIVNVIRQAGCEVPEYMLKIQKPPRRDQKKLAKMAPERDPILNENFISEEMKQMMKKRKKKMPNKKKIFKKKSKKESEGNDE